jgi:microcystin-dependent protein
VLGQSYGSESVTLLSTEMPNHSHSLNAYLQGTDRQTAPANGYSLASSTHASSFLGGAPPVDTMFAPQTIGVAGGSQPHENRQPFLALNFCIALEGIYPSFG